MPSALDDPIKSNLCHIYIYIIHIYIYIYIYNTYIYICGLSKPIQWLAKSSAGQGTCCRHSWEPPEAAANGRRRRRRGSRRLAATWHLTNGERMDLTMKNWDIYPMVLLIIIPFLKMAISLGILTQHFQTNPYLSIFLGGSPTRWGPPSYKLAYKPHEYYSYLRTINHSWAPKIAFSWWT